jgi:hypothetical protein
VVSLLLSNGPSDCWFGDVDALLEIEDTDNRGDLGEDEKLDLARTTLNLGGEVSRSCEAMDFM